MNLILTMSPLPHNLLQASGLACATHLFILSKDMGMTIAPILSHPALGLPGAIPALVPRLTPRGRTPDKPRRPPPTPSAP